MVSLAWVVNRDLSLERRYVSVMLILYNAGRYIVVELLYFFLYVSLERVT